MFAHTGRIVAGEPAEHRDASLADNNQRPEFAS